MGKPLSPKQRQRRIAEARRKSRANRPVGDATRPHVRRRLKVVPMKDKDGKPIPWNPEVIVGGPWKVKHGIDIDGKNTRPTKRR